MIIVFSAIYKEVQPIVETLNLNKTDEFKPFSCFENDSIKVVITGVGKLRMSTAVGYVLGRISLSEVSHVVNLGICAGDVIDKTYIINAVTDKETGLNFYPDMLFSSPFDESPIITSDKIASSSEMVTGYLYDMEASAFIQSSSTFLAPSKISILKCVSDNGIDNCVSLSLDSVYELINKNKEEIVKYVSVLDCSLNSYDSGKLDESIDLLVEKYSEKLFLSEYMRNELKTIIRFCKLSDTDFEKIVEDYLPVSNRKEGKVVIEKLYEQFV